ncbi:hypothetical protein PSACC_01867 [Paramicrosporidium saccamoebae]|uniref:Uncharacterized protein n=1 Tax=Paramicrosporidium saccamoebae TaxID=1246581 RepID=A0A2H9TKN2_9FUNG|nr:hypothetical protein PSACC_01867 [Paramicrosporidium saccamoebae]
MSGLHVGRQCILLSGLLLNLLIALILLSKIGSQNGFLEHPKRQTVYCYFENMNGPPGMIVLLWLRNWHIRGFNPRLLTLEHAEAHPNYHQYVEAFDRLPTVNHRRYELGCYRRWLALRTVGGGTFSDYDILPFGPVKVPPINSTTFASYTEYAPMYSHGGLDGLLRYIDFMATYSGPVPFTYDKPHLSDMVLLRGNMNSLLTDNLPPPPLLHFSKHENEQFIAQSGQQSKKERFAADSALMVRLTGRRVTLLMPPGVQLVGDPVDSGFGMRRERVDELISYFKQCTCQKQIAPYIPKSFDDLSVTITDTFPNVISGVDLIFFVYAPDMANLYDKDTLDALVEHIESPHTIPLLANDPEAIQLVIGYNLGWIGEEPIAFTYSHGPAGPHRLFHKKFNQLVQQYREIDGQLNIVKECIGGEGECNWKKPYK